MKENFNLFDKMHEGVIVLDRADECLKFVSEPAIRLLKQLSDKVSLYPNQ